MGGGCQRSEAWKCGWTGSGARDKKDVGAGWGLEGHANEAWDCQVEYKRVARKMVQMGYLWAATSAQDGEGRYIAVTLQRPF